MTARFFSLNVSMAQANVGLRKINANLRLAHVTALQFEAVGRFSEDEKQTVRELLEGMILKHEARRWDAARAAAEPAKKPAAAKRPTRTANR